MAGVIQVGSQAQADRYAYIPLIGIFVAVVWAAADLIARFLLEGIAQGQPVIGLALILIVVVILLGGDPRPLLQNMPINQRKLLALILATSWLFGCQQSSQSPLDKNVATIQTKSVNGVFGVDNELRVAQTPKPAKKKNKKNKA